MEGEMPCHDSDEMGVCSHSDIIDFAQDMAAAEVTHVPVEERLYATVGMPVTVILCNGLTLTGVLERVADDGVILMQFSGMRAVVPLSAIAVARGLPQRRHSSSRTSSMIREGLRVFVRTSARVAVYIEAGTIVGTILRVGYDHCDMRVGDGSSVAAGAQGSHITLMFAAVQAVCEMHR